MVGVSWRQGGSESLAEFTLAEDVVAVRLREFAQRLQLARARLPVDVQSGRAHLLAQRANSRPGFARRGVRAPDGQRTRARGSGTAPACLAGRRRGRASVLDRGRSRLGLRRGDRGGRPSAHEPRARARARSLRSELGARVRGGTAHRRTRARRDESGGRARVVGGDRRAAVARAITAHTGSSCTPRRVADDGACSPLARASASAVIIVNRSADKAAALARRFGAAHTSLEEFRRSPPPLEALLTATGADHAVLDEAALERLAARTPSGQPPLIVDMAVPADVSPEVCAKLAIQRIGMDDITRHAEDNRAARLLEAAPAREQVDEALAKLHDRFTERYYGPLFGALQQRYRQTAQEGVKRLLKKELKGLGAEERAAIETWSEVLARRFAHIPCLGLRGLLHDGPDGSIEAFLGGLEPNLRDRAACGARTVRPGQRPRRRGEGSQTGAAASCAWARAAGSLRSRNPRPVADALRARGHDVELAVIKTAGDRAVRRAVPLAIGPQGVFVREIEQALVEGQHRSGRALLQGSADHLRRASSRSPRCRRGTTRRICSSSATAALARERATPVAASCGGRARRHSVGAPARVAYALPYGPRQSSRCAATCRRGFAS